MTSKLQDLGMQLGYFHHDEWCAIFFAEIGLCVFVICSRVIFYQSIASSQIKEEPEAEAAEEETEVSEKSVKSDQAEKKTVELTTFGTQTEDPEKSPTPPPRTPTPPVVVEVRETQVC